MVTFKDTPDSPERILSILHPVVKEWFGKKFGGFALPQQYAVLDIHSRNNILVSAPTGTGKTLTAFLSVLNELIDSSQKGILLDKVYVVYVSPLKALSNDIEKNLREPLGEIEGILQKPLNIRVGVRTGDTSASERARMAKKPPHILITTPESLAIILSTIKFREYLRGVQWLIVDEVHALAENKRGVHLSLTMERLSALSPGLTRVGLSATISPLQEIARFLVGYEGDAERSCIIVDVQFIKQLDLKVISPVADLIDNTYEVMHHSMYTLLDDLIQQHKTTLIFTNTRAATERVVHHLKDKFPLRYAENIGAHHGSLSRDFRFSLEGRLRKGELKVVVTSTSLELGIDIGFIDLVILLGSPKSVARALQRVGRSGHQLHAVTKGRLVVLDRDDLVECGVLLKSALEKKIDKIHIPRNALDVLAQHIYGIAISGQIHFEELLSMVRKSYCYHEISRRDVQEVVDYLAGKFISLEDRHVYAKIWHDESSGMIGRKGKLARLIYMTNIGTIPDESSVQVKVGMQLVGTIDEAFLERLRPGDVFVLGGQIYEYRFSRGMVAQVKASPERPPTVPSWFSEQLPLSFDLALDIGRFRRLMNEKFCAGKGKEGIMQFIDSYLSVDRKAANSIYAYFFEQYNYAKIPSLSLIVIEHCRANRASYAIFHTLFGRRVNDCLSRAVAYAISRSQHRDVELGVSDNGFYVSSPNQVNVAKAFSLLKSDQFDRILELSIENSEVLKRRFRHCAVRALMILRNYRGKEKRVGRQQVSSMLLMSAVKRISQNFCILKEARREVLEDLMDRENAMNVLKGIEQGKIRIEEIQTSVPSPFAFNLFAWGHFDILKMEGKL